MEDKENYTHAEIKDMLKKFVSYRDACNSRSSVYMCLRGDSAVRAPRSKEEIKDIEESLNPFEEETRQTLENLKKVMPDSFARILNL